MRSLRPIQVMKRPRSSSSLSPSSNSKSPSLPSTPPSPQTLHRSTRHSKPTSISACYPSRRPKPIIDSLKGSSQPDPVKWVPLNLAREELYLPLTFPTGQTFRWRETGPLQYTGVVGSHLVSLKHVENGDVSFCLRHTDSESDARTALLDFLNAGVSLTDMWKAFSDSDARFAELARHLSGARVLRQDPLECLIQFLCSSNNNIQRITKMVDYISSLGNYVGTVGGFKFHTFPTMEQLSLISEEELRKAGFGYRLNVITFYDLNSYIYICA